MFLTLGSGASLINKYTQFKDTRGIMLFLNFGACCTFFTSCTPSKVNLPMRCYNLTTARQHLAQVTALILDGQQLEQIPPEVWEMPQLETLDLRRNAIKELPKTIGELKALKFLFLGKNQLRQLPQSLPNLMQIDLSANHFTGFPVEIGRAHV